NINLALVQKLAETIRQVDAVVDAPAPVDALDILRWPGVINTEAVDSDTLSACALELFDKVLSQFTAHREREGAELARLVEQRLAAITAQVEKLRQRVPAIMQAQRDKLLERLAGLKEEVNPERLEQELVFYAHKADVDEELDRLATHVTEVRHALKQKGA